MTANLPSGLTTHTRKVQSLYKRAIRDLESWYYKRDVFRYQATLMRKRFDDNKNIKDVTVAKSLLEQGENELFKTLHWHPKKFPHSPGGVAYSRTVVPPDWIVDHWHPLEKAQYPEYFARREQRKKEFTKQWEQVHGKSTTFHH